MPKVVDGETEMMEELVPPDIGSNAELRKFQDALNATESSGSTPRAMQEIAKAERQRRCERHVASQRRDLRSEKAMHTLQRNAVEDNVSKLRKSGPISESSLRSDIMVRTRSRPRLPARPAHCLWRTVKPERPSNDLADAKPT